MIPANPSEWGREFSKLALEVFGLDAADTRYSSMKEWEQAFHAGETPEEAIDYLAEKDGLVKAEDFTFQKATRTMRRFANGISVDISR